MSSTPLHPEIERELERLLKPHAGSYISYGDALAFGRELAAWITERHAGICTREFMEGTHKDHSEAVRKSTYAETR